MYMCEYKKCNFKICDPNVRHVCETCFRVNSDTLSSNLQSPCRCGQAFGRYSNSNLKKCSRRARSPKIRRHRLNEASTTKSDFIFELRTIDLPHISTLNLIGPSPVLGPVGGGVRRKLQSSIRMSQTRSKHVFESIRTR